MGYVFAICYLIVSQRVSEFFPSQRCYIWHFLYVHFSHGGRGMVVSHCDFNLHFVLPGFVAASGMKFRHLMKEATVDMCLF